MHQDRRFCLKVQSLFLLVITGYSPTAHSSSIDIASITFSQTSSDHRRKVCTPSPGPLPIQSWLAPGNYSFPGARAAGNASGPFAPTASAPLEPGRAPFYYEARNPTFDLLRKRLPGTTGQDLHDALCTTPKLAGCPDNAIGCTTRPDYVFPTSLSYHIDFAETCSSEHFPVLDAFLAGPSNRHEVRMRNPGVIIVPDLPSVDRDKIWQYLLGLGTSQATKALQGVDLLVAYALQHERIHEGHFNQYYSKIQKVINDPRYKKHYSVAPGADPNPLLMADIAKDRDKRLKDLAAALEKCTKDFHDREYAANSYAKQVFTCGCDDVVKCENIIPPKGPKKFEGVFICKWPE